MWRGAELRHITNTVRDLIAKRWRPRDILKKNCLLLRIVVLLLSVFVASTSDALAQSRVDATSPERRFITGLSAVEQGRPDLAIPIFRDILAIDPDLVRVRLELARAYFLAEQWTKAREEFFFVLSGDLPEPVRARVLSYIRMIDARRGFEWDLELAIEQVGDRRQFDTDQIMLDYGGIALPFTLDRMDDTALGLSYAGSVKLRRPVEAMSLGQFSAGVFAEGFAYGIEAEGRRFDDMIIGARGGLRWVGPRSTWSMAPVVQARYLEQQHAEDRLGLEFAFERRSDFGMSFFAALDRDAINNIRSDAFDGDATSATLGLRKSFGGRASAGLALLAERVKYENPFESYDSYGLRAFGGVDAAYGFTFAPSLTMRRKEFEQNNPLFTEEPDETIYNAALRIEKNDWFVFDGFSPFGEISGEWVQSGISAFSYHEYDLSIGLQRNF